MTDCERLLRVLLDRKPHGHAELYRMGMIVHSRIADLRKKGYQIECRNVGRAGGRALYEYQLIGLLPRPETNALGPCVSGYGSGSPHSAAEPGEDDELRDPSASSPPPQLALELPGSVYRKDIAA